MLSIGSGAVSGQSLDLNLTEDKTQLFALTERSAVGRAWPRHALRGFPMASRQA